MSLISLTTEVIEQIISIIAKDKDRNTLYYLCLTSKILCKITMPYLWKKSLYIQRYYNQYSDKNNTFALVISILLTFIKNTNVKNSFVKYSLDLKEYNRYCGNIPSNPLFNYPSFVKQIDF